MKVNVVCPYCLAHCRQDFDEWLLNKRGVKQFFHQSCYKRQLTKENNSNKIDASKCDSSR